MTGKPDIAPAGPTLDERVAYIEEALTMHTRALRDHGARLEMWELLIIAAGFLSMGYLIAKRQFGV